jgi:microcystin-dependent protein
MAKTIINFSDPSKTSLEVNDGQINNNSTSLTYIGKKYPESYSKIIAENFLHLLENFASTAEPNSPVQGQLWFNPNNLQEVDSDIDSATNSFGLKMRVGNSWLPIGVIKKAAVSPSSGNLQSSNLKKGDLYVDTSKNQLYIYNGSGYSLVGPFFNSFEKTGIEVEEIIDSADNRPISVVTFFIKARRIAIFSDKTFTPKLIYEGFKNIKQGVNLSNSAFDIDTTFWGTSEKAKNLIVGDTVVLGNNFLRSDVISTTNFEFNVRSNKGLNLGPDGSFNIANDNTGAFLYNKNSDSDIDFRFKRADSNDFTTVVRITGRNNGRVGINKTNPQEVLDVTGNIQVTGNFIGTNLLASGNIDLGGKITVTNNIEFATSPNINIGKITNVNDILPRNGADLGAEDTKWGTVYVERIGSPQQYPLIYGNIVANQLVVGGNGRTQLKSDLNNSSVIILVETTADFPASGTLIIDNEEITYTSKLSDQFTGVTRGSPAVNHSNGTFVFLKVGTQQNFGTIDGLSRGLSSPITLVTSADSDILFEESGTGSTSIAFQNAGQLKTIKTTLNNNLITSKTVGNLVKNEDLFLIQDPNDNAYYKVSKNTLANSLPIVPIGTIILWTGSLSNIPTGYLPCDGRELVKTFDQPLFNVIGYRYRTQGDLPSAGGTVDTFCLPDLRSSVPNFYANQLLKGLSYAITDVGTTDWSTLGFTGTPQVNSVFLAAWSGATNPGTGTGRARLADGLHYIIFTGKL